jgi:hypothetical protein
LGLLTSDGDGDGDGGGGGAGVEPDRAAQVRDVLVPAAAGGRADREAGGVHADAEPDPVHRVRPGGHGEPHQLHGRGVGGLLRRALLDHVEAAHVRVPGLGAGAARDPGVQEGVPRVLRPRPRLRQQAPGPDLRLRRLPPQVSHAKQPTIRRLLAPVRLCFKSESLSYQRSHFS